MAVEIHTAAARLIDRYVLFWENRNIRRTEKKVCRAHPEWVKLTTEELSCVDSKDRWEYTIYRNMAPEGSRLEYFVPEAPYLCKLVPALNPLNHLKNSLAIDCIFSDKNYHEVFMKGLPFPKTLIRRVSGQLFDADFSPISADEAVRILNGYDELVFKQTVETGHGTGIRKLDRAEFEEAVHSYANDYLVQELIQQHPMMAYFNPTSVNVIRITTMFWRGDVYVLGGILRVGATGAFCDHENRGGENYLSIPIADDGTIIPRPVDVTSYEVMDDCHGVPVKGCVPGYREILDLVRQYHLLYPNYKLIGWDIAIDTEEKPIFVEFNTRYPGIIGTQCALGPVFAQKSTRGVPLLDEIREAGLL